jgi:hypothetical protein
MSSADLGEPEWLAREYGPGSTGNCSLFQCLNKTLTNLRAASSDFVLIINDGMKPRHYCRKDIVTGLVIISCMCS